METWNATESDTHLWFGCEVHLVRMRLPSLGRKRGPQFSFWPAEQRKQKATTLFKHNLSYFELKKHPPFNSSRGICFSLHADNFNIPAAWNHPLPQQWCNAPTWRRVTTQLSVRSLCTLESSAKLKTDSLFKKTTSVTSWTPGLRASCLVLLSVFQACGYADQTGTCCYNWPTCLRRVPSPLCTPWFCSAPRSESCSLSALRRWPR